MSSFSNLTPNTIRLVIQTYDKNKISYQTQDIFNSSRYYSTITYLRKIGFFNPCCSIDGCNKYIDENNGGVCEKNDKQHRNGNKTFRYDRNTLAGEIWAIAFKDLKKKEEEAGLIK